MPKYICFIRRGLPRPWAGWLPGSRRLRVEGERLFGLLKPTQEVILKGVQGLGRGCEGGRVHARHYFLLLTPRPHCKPAPRPSPPPPLPPSLHLSRVKSERKNLEGE